MAGEQSQQKGRDEQKGTRHKKHNFISRFEFDKVQDVSSQANASVLTTTGEKRGPTPRDNLAIVQELVHNVCCAPARVLSG